MFTSIITRSRASKRRIPPSITHSYSTRSQKRRKLDLQEKLNPLPDFDNINASNDFVFNDQMVPDISCSVVDSLNFDLEHSDHFYTNTHVKFAPPKIKPLRIFPNPKGAFQLLPNEIIHLVLLFLDHSGLGALGLTSTQMCDVVRDYVYTHRGLKQIFPLAPVSPVDEVDPDLFRRLGELYRQIVLQFVAW